MPVPLLSLPLFLFLFLSACQSSAPFLSGSPPAANGIIDLSGWDFAKKGCVELNGAWEFYWRKLLTPGDFTAGPGTNPAPDAYMKVPGIWNGVPAGGKPLPGYGYATYRLRVLLAPGGGRYGLKFKEVDTAYRAWVNGVPAVDCGTPGTNEKTCSPCWKRHEFFFDAAGSADIVIQVANFHHRKGGLEDPVCFGTLENIITLKKNNSGLELFILGVLMIMAFYNAGLFLFRRRERSSLFFSVFCVMIGLRLLLTGEKQLLDLFPFFDWEIAVKIEYLSFYLSIALFMEYLRALFPSGFRKSVRLFVLLVAGVFSLAVLALPARLFSRTLIPFEVFTAACVVYAIVMLARIFFSKTGDIPLLFSGMAVLLLAFVNDVLYNNGLVPTGYIFPYGLFIFIVTQSILLSRRFSKSFRQVERMSHELEGKNRKLKEWSDIFQEQSLEKINLLNTAVEQSGDSIVITSAEGLIEYVNPKFINITGYTAGEAAGKNPSILKSGELPRSEYEKLWKTITEGNVWRGEFHNRKKNGELYWEAATITPILDNRGKIAHYLGVKEDITEKKSIEAELNRERRELALRNQILEMQMEMARRIQTRILTGAPPDSGIGVFYKPMDKIGGDFYEIVQFRDKYHVGVFISDVSGHGVPAALITSMVKSLVSQAGARRNAPSELLKFMNDSLHRQTGENFVTALYGVLDKQAGELCFSSAGHNMPYIIGKDNVTHVKSTKSGPPLAIYNNDELERYSRPYSDSSVKVNPGDKVLIYTDGLVEAFSPHHTDFFETAGLQEALCEFQPLAAVEFVVRIYEKLVAFHGSDNFDDDVCMVCLSV